MKKKWILDIYSQFKINIICIMPLSKKRLINARNGTLNNAYGKKSGLLSRIGRSGTFRWFKVNKDCCNPIIVNIISVVANNARQIRIIFNNPHGLTSTDDFVLQREDGHNLTIGSDGDFANENYILLPITPNLNGSDVLDETSTYTLSYNGDKIATSTNNNVEDIKNLPIESAFIGWGDLSKNVYVNFKTDLSNTNILDISQAALFNVSELSDVKITNIDISNTLISAFTSKYKDVSGSIILNRTVAANPATEIDISFGTYIPDTQGSFPDSSGSIFDKHNYWIVGISSELSNKNPTINVKNNIREDNGILTFNNLVDLSLNASTTKIDLSLNYASDISYNVDNFSLDISFNFGDISNGWRTYHHNVLVPQLLNNSRTIVIDISGISGNDVTDASSIAHDISKNWNNIRTNTFNIDISGINNVVYTKINPNYLLVNNEYVKSDGSFLRKYVTKNKLSISASSGDYKSSTTAPQQLLNPDGQPII